MRAFIGGVLMITGLMMVAGSAGDCDGKCMEQANSLGEMLAVAAGGIFAMIVGYLAAWEELSH
jgi:hypothetical protein